MCSASFSSPGFYLISPSEFERFSLSARCVVEPRSLVEVPSQTPSTTLPQAQPDGPSVKHRYTPTASLLVVFTIDFGSTAF